ncbi:A disintegrin and metalloproteinase with thrombospondin motifs 9-like [Ostrea edulis]|uniref:A disintegrin and metalloproteinase with thrombospondin motifs 9-like n=1 Tax=Ostrea edulis TaxID=37623 RepID=UPI0024AF7205|nr:A disintegrin and metalloproteinase with thrombospondin motifs 9-like [Ostrea edulis]
MVWNDACVKLTQSKSSNSEEQLVMLIPESCADLASCSVTSTDGEYWIYPKATSGQRVKIYCHNIRTNPKEYITLKYTNTFVEHDPSNFMTRWQTCRTDYKLPLKSAIFSRVAMNIQDMTVIGSDYTFAVRTGNFKLEFGEAQDCNGYSSMSGCHRFGNAVINTLGTGLILDRNAKWGLINAHKAGIQNFERSEDGAEISITCAGYCGHCGPLSKPLRLILSSEFVSDKEARAEVCRM